MSVRVVVVRRADTQPSSYFASPPKLAPWYYYDEVLTRVIRGVYQPEK